MNTSYIGMLILGLFISVLDISNLKGNISSIHWYNRTKVGEEEMAQYGKYMGIGTIIIGGTIALTAAVFLFVVLAPVLILTVAGVLVGVGLMLYAQFRYNGGIF